MTTLEEFRKKYPAYNNRSDAELADAIYRKFYSAIPREQFDRQMGLSSSTAPRDRPLPDERTREAIKSRRAIDENWFNRNIAEPTGTIAIDPHTGKLQPRGVLDPIMRPLMEGATLTLGDEARAVGSGIGSFVRGEGFQKGYDEAAQWERDENARIAREHPYMAPALRVVGSLAAGMPAKGVASTAAPVTVRQASGTGAKVGGAYGAVSGFGSGEGGIGNRAKGALIGGTVGAAIGGALPLAAAGVGKAVDWARGARQQQAVAPTTVDLRRQSQDLYKAAEGQGLIVPSQRFGDFSTKLAQKMKSEGIDPTLHPKATAALKRIQDAAADDIGLNEIDTLRKIANDAMKSADEGEQRVASILIDKIDDFIDDLKPADVVAGNPEAAAQLIKEARLNWHRMRKSMAIENALYRADLRAGSAGSGGNVDNAIRQEIKSLLLNKSMTRTWTAEERVIMERLAKGAPLDNFIRLVGKLSPEGSGLMAFLQGGLAMGTGGASLPAAAIGFGAKRMADAKTRAGTEAIRGMVASGQIPQLVQQTFGPATQRILQLLTQAGASATGRKSAISNSPSAQAR